MLAGIGITSTDRVVVDIGNSRIKIGRIDSDGALASVEALAYSDSGTNLAAWRESFERFGISQSTRWAIASVNPPMANEFASALEGIWLHPPSWYRTAADVPIETRVRRPEMAGADRALIALAGRTLAYPAESGLVISCGTAMTIERVTLDGVWEGGAIAPGLQLSARSLFRGTAQIPSISPKSGMSAWGDNTETAVGGGVLWGTVGAARELIARQNLPGWRIWTGGDAPLIAPEVEESPWIVSDLVLRGLAFVAFHSSQQALGR